MDTYKAYRIYTEPDRVIGRFDQVTIDELDPGDVVIDAAYSAVNYKDAMAARGIGKNIRRDPPCIGGVDVSGVVRESADPRLRPGDPVVVTSFGLGANHDGGYSQVVRVPADWVVRLPEGLTLREAMGLGSAGLTAALAVERLEAGGLRPEAGPVAVTGASGAVGSLAVDIFSGRGYRVSAITGKDTEHDYLRSLGADEVISRHAIEMDERPLGPTRWAGAVDTVGEQLLAWLTKTMQFHGKVALCGGAAGFGLSTTVLPFILRAVDFYGVNITRSLDVPTRLRLWQRLASDLRPGHLDAIIHEIPFDGLPRAFDDIIEAKAKGRIVVAIDGS